MEVETFSFLSVNFSLFLNLPLSKTSHDTQNTEMGSFMTPIVFCLNHIVNTHKWKEIIENHA